MCYLLGCIVLLLLLNKQPLFGIICLLYFVFPSASVVGGKTSILLHDAVNT